MDVTAKLIQDNQAPWATKEDIIVLPAWPSQSKIIFQGKRVYPLDILREKKIRSVISFHEIAEGGRTTIEFGSRDLIINPRFFVDIWSYNDLMLQRIADQVDDYYTRATRIGELDIVRFTSNGKMPSEDFSRRQYLLQISYKKGVL